MKAATVVRVVAAVLALGGLTRLVAGAASEPVPSWAKVSEWQKQGAARDGVPVAKEVDLGGGVTLKLVYVPSGQFDMGSNDGLNNEKPVHTVRLAKGFYLGVTEVTQGQWQAMMGKNNPSSFKGAANPVDTVSWNECQAFVKKAGQGLRLPTEAEWEYACRAGSTGRYCFGDDESKLGEYAWYKENSGGKTHPVGQKTPNAWGLYDMHGNVFEWCQSLYKGYPYEATDGRESMSDGGSRVLRGGSWSYGATFCGSAPRSCFGPIVTCNCGGFRVAAE